MGDREWWRVETAVLTPNANKNTVHIAHLTITWQNIFDVFKKNKGHAVALTVPAEKTKFGTTCPHSHP